MDQKRVEGDELLRGVANRMNKLSGKGEVATKHQCVAARVLNPRSSIDQHGRNNDGVQPRVFENPIAYGEPRVSESSKQNGLSKSDSMVNPTSLGESWTVNPSRECVIEVEEGAGLAEGDDISVLRMAGSFVLKDPNLDVNNIDATTEAVANERSYTSLGESTIRSTMNPSCGSKSDVEEGIWSTKDPPHLVSEVNTQPGMSTNMTSIVHEANEFGYIRPTGWNLTNKYNVPTKNDDDAPITQSVDINSTPNSYAGAAVLEKVSVRLEHTLYGYFIGKRLAFPVVEYYARNNWAKHGLKRIMMNAKGFFFFKFDSRAGLDAVLEGGPWMIRNSPIILKKWSVNTSLQKEEMTRIPIWVKLHDVPIQVFEEDGISLIASYIGKHIMLDSYTIMMCKESWGRSSFARCLIKINSEAEFTESITIGIPELEGPGFIKETIHVEYEWKPPRCHTCNIFGYLGDSCPKKVVNTPVVNNSTNTNTPNDGFQQVANKRRNNKKNAVGNTIPRGVPVAKGFQVGKQFNYQPKAPKTNSDGGSTREATSSKVGSSSYSNEGASHKVTSIDKQNDKDVVDTGAMKISNISSPNPFTVLGEVEDEDEDIENVYDESENLNLNHNPGASTPAQTVPDVYVCAILESHVDVAVVYDTCKKVCSRWKWTSNGSLCDKGSRIILGKNDNLVDVMIKAQTNQVMHVQVNTRIDNKTLFCSFIYADNYYIDRRALWNNLVGHAGLMRNRPWVLLGDFNAALNIEDHSSGGYEPNVAMRDFKECVQAMEVADVNSTWIYFTWNQKPKGSNGILKKIDKIMVVKRLKGLKSHFRKLLHNHGNLHDRVNKIHIELDEAHNAIDRDPSSSVLREEHAHYLLAFKEAYLDEERFLKQKAKVEWLKAGDSNTSYFHKIVKSKCAKNRIEMVSDSSNNFYNGNQVPGAFVKHYNQFLRAEGVSNPVNAHDLFIRVLDNSKADCMVCDVTDDEIKSVMFSMEDDRASGPDSFTVAFFKKAWDVVGGDITCVIRDFFFLQCKIIANRVKEGLGDIVSINQSAFVPGRRISDNILLTQKLIRNYHRRRSPPRCAFKVDIQKAYDTMDWNFLETILVGFGFHPKMVQWIMVCVSGASYSISVNGNVYGWFKGKRGLRQDEFQYHHLCEQQRIINLCFADDLFLFARGHPSSVSVIMDALEEFKQVSGLVPSIPKSTAYFCNVPNAIKASILNSMPFAEGVLPASVFILPSRIVHDLEQLMRGFLWCQGEMKKGKAKVAWDSVCMPKHEGSLGIRRIEDSNIALMATHIWSIFTHRESLMITCSLSVLFLRRCGLRIVVAATSYYIWLERNGRLFKKKTSTPGQIVDVIFSTVRLKLVTFKFKKMSTKSRLLLDQWKIPSYCIVHDGSTRQPYLDLYCSYRVAAGLRDARLIICSHLGLCLV
ncbi:sodium/hydrogen exchanger 6 [Tanacetum coccineum]|uniref:Sodium/hydrogen exchanger 6 n=1 Tax=Tanacetum coccineum TaxID=301880 RepID=A0ABQ5G2A7_9ASTR